MSTYYTIEAELTYKTVKDLEEAVKPLRKGGWLKDDNSLVSEDGFLADQNEPVVIDGRKLRIPCALYRNMGRVTYGAFFNGLESGFYNSFCEDGCVEMESNSFELDDDGEICISSETLNDDDISSSLDSIEKTYGFTLEGKEKDSLTMDDAEWVNKYELPEDVFYETMSNSYYKVFEAISVPS